MRALADYIMRGRAQAVLIAILGIPVISQSVLTLVTLRRGAWEGLSLLVWSFAPFLLLLWNDGEYLPLAMASLGMLGTAYVGALCLRSGLSWSITVWVVVSISVLLGILFLQIFSQHLSVFLQQLVELQKTTLESQGRTIDPSLLVVPANLDVVGVLVFGAATNCVLVLALGRWWQSLLYNPGGFRQEFSQLRLSRISASLCGAILLLCGLMVDYREWAWVLGLPLVLVSVSVAHQFASVQRMGLAWLVIFYIALANFPFYLAMAALGLADAWLDLRKTILPKTTKGPGNGKE